MTIGSKIIFYNLLPSTNSHAAALLKKTRPSEGTVIYAGYQSKGRGQTGNKWESEANKNLLISTILYPSMVRPEDQFLLSMFVSVGICDFLERFTPSVSIKWPNDIYVNNDKIAGILIENSIMVDRIEHTIAGIGLNINQVRFLSDAPNPVSLANLTGRQHDLLQCLNQLIADLDRRYEWLIAGNHEELKSNYMSRLYRLNNWGMYRDMGGLFRGRISGVSDSGSLQVEGEDGTIRDYPFKEIDFIFNDHPLG